jgi:branched-chain amino acid transport system permease protein
MTEATNPASGQWPARLGWLLCLIVLLCLPLFLDKYHTHIVTGALIFAIAAVALQLLLGVAGLLSLGQAAFLGIGAYTSALLTTVVKLPFELGFLLAGAVSGISSLLLAPITRLRGTYLGVATLAFTIIVHLVILNEEWLTGGSFGMMKIPKHGLGSWSFQGEFPSYYLCLAVLALVCAAIQRMVPSRFGRALQAIMLNEDAARASGVNVTLYKSQAFVVAAVVTGFAGALFAHHSQYLNPNDFTLWKSVEILLMVAVGGIGSIAGAVIGAFVVVLLPELLRFADEYRMVIFASLLIVLMGVGQDGIAGLFASLGRRLNGLLQAARAPSLQRDAAE